MNILVIGGTRYMGVHLVKYLLSDGHKVTIATRGQTRDCFGGDVDRIILDRTNPESLYNALNDKHFDVAYDSLAYCSNDIKYLLEALRCNKYIEISTMSVYPKIKPQLTEADFKPEAYPLKWCRRNDFPYDEVKRQAESALFQVYGNIPAAAIRFPYVIGEDDYTKRLFFYVEHIMNSIPMYINNRNEKMAFIQSQEAGRFLAWMANNDFCGCINAASYGNISLSDIISYIEDKTNKKALLLDTGEEAPYNGTPEYSMDLRKAEELGFQFSDLNMWIYNLLDTYINGLRQ